VKLEWSDKLFATGYDDVDNDHRKIIDAMNDLIDGLQNDHPSASIMETMGFLEMYTIEHFRREEEVMESVHCSVHLQNKREHMDFERKLSNFRLQFENDGINKQNLKEFLTFISEWISNHIQKTDITLRNTISR